MPDAISKSAAPAAQTIYLDNQATTPTDPRVLQDVINMLQTRSVGNPHSEHFVGRRAAAAVEVARAQIADLIGARPEEIFFTSGATEANNIAIRGIGRHDQGRNHVLTVATEHKCVLESALSLRDQGFDVEILPVGEDGLLDLDQLSSSIRDRTALVSVMAANNEIGVLQPIADVAAICRERDIVFHTDAAQAAGKIPLDVRSTGIDLMSLSGHKLYAPIGIGALFISDDSPIRPEGQLRGGGQEGGIRSGTLPAHLAVAMGTAAAICRESMQVDATHASSLRQRFLEIVQSRIPYARVNAESAPRLPGNLSLTIPGVDADHLVGALQPHVAVSTNAACSSGVLQPSHVLQAIGLRNDLAESTIRLGFGRFNTLQEVETAAVLISDVAAQIGENRGASAA
ncbi:cysteine desulfurase [Bradyrhizobium brasilense]|uniref:Cysteine desulfurase n=1 Tax=Bradyrhizobium brasilense TaxID=1419277 RepID=A0A1G6RVC6_9BRAD|nr:cysteine desulfurase family protein [Bradyrhizobium brasilense]SDD08518.1 cysteine desulfurase [Bradyrhizobium brasilense]